MWRKTLVFVRSTQIDLQRLFLWKIEEKHEQLSEYITHENIKDDHTWPVPYEDNGGRSVGRGRSSTCTRSGMCFKVGFLTQISKCKMCFSCEPISELKPEAATKTMKA